VAVGVLGVSRVVLGDPISPTYSRTYIDCTTYQNQQTNTAGKERWTITPGCDSYQTELYERPTTQTFQVNQTTSGEIFAAAEYFENLDIEAAYAGVDTNYMYVAIDLVGLDRVTEDGVSTLEGLKYEYQFLLSTDPDGTGGYWFSMLDASQLGTAYQIEKNEGQLDLFNLVDQTLPPNPDVGGPGGISVTRQDSIEDGTPNVIEEAGNGYETDWIDKGALKFAYSGYAAGTKVFWTRIDPNDATVIEFVIDYKALGFTQAQIEQIIAGNIGFLDFRSIKGDPADPQNYLWNDKYFEGGAGSPYRCGTTSEVCSDLTKDEFGQQGPQNIYELDNLRVGRTVPEPGSWLLLSSGLVLVGLSRYRFRR
jgi:hypothetical protein